MGFVHGLPVGLSLMGPAWSEDRLLALGAAFEKIVPARRAPHFLPSLESAPSAAAALRPNH
jgi:amidase